MQLLIFLYDRHKCLLRSVFSYQYTKFLLSNKLIIFILQEVYNT